MLRLLSLLALIAVWVLASHGTDERLLPPPLAVFETIIHEAESGALFVNLGATLARVAAAFALAMSFGMVFGIVMGRSKTADRIGDPWLVVLLNLPALVIIVLAYIWIGLSETAAILAVALNKLPNTTATIREGARAIDAKLEEMATVFAMSRRTRLRHILLPQLAPYIAAATRSGLSLVWKIVLVVELMGRSNGVGFEIGIAFQLFDVKLLLAYALPFVGIMLAIETFILQPFERHVSRWRPDSIDIEIAQKIFRSAAGEMREVFRDFALRMTAGEVRALVGASGCGKTSLLRLIVGLDRDYRGTITLPAQTRIGMVFQEPRLLPWRSVYDNLRLAAPAASAADLVKIATDLGLGEHLNHYPGELLTRPRTPCCFGAGLCRRPQSSRARQALRVPRPITCAAPQGRAGFACRTNQDDDAPCHPRRRRGDRAGRPNHPPGRAAGPKSSAAST